jgi:thiol-disulfide isomerase/thioredoxin
MKKPIKIVTSEGCPPCQEVKRSLKNEISKGEVKIVDINSGEGKKLRKAFNLKYVPSFVVSDGNNLCEIEKDGKIKKCVPEK